jgi:chaperonin cofactor prefoldin
MSDENGKLLDLILQKLDKIDDKVDRLEQRGPLHEEKISELKSEQEAMNAILKRNTETLEIHVRRCDNLQVMVEDLYKRFKPIEDKYFRSIIIKDFLTKKVGKVVAVIGVLGTIVGIVYGIAMIWFK